MALYKFRIIIIIIIIIKRSFENGIHRWLKQADARESAAIIYLIIM